MNNYIRKQKGITLIALVITIIVLIILAGVSIAMLTGDNSILKNTEKAKIDGDNARLEEYKKLLESELKIDKYMGSSSYNQDEMISLVARNLGVGEENITGNLIKSPDGKYGIMVKDDNSIEVAKYEDAYVSANYIDTTNESDFVWKELEDGTIWVTEYIGTAKSINIPETINGKSVSKVGGDKTWITSLAVVVDENGNCHIDENNTVSERGGSVIRNKVVKSIKFPSDIDEIGCVSFGSAGIEEVFFSGGPEIIKSDTFRNNKIKRLKVPERTKSILEYAFAGNLLEKLEYNSNLECIGAGTFKDNNLEKITIPNSLKNYGDSAYTGNKDEKILYGIKDGVEDRTKINSYCGRNAGDIVIPSNVKYIAGGAFSSVGLTSIYVPESVKTIGSQAIGDHNGHISSIIIKGKPTLTIWSIDFASADYLELNYTSGKKKTYPQIEIKHVNRIVVPSSDDDSIINSYIEGMSSFPNMIYINSYDNIEEKTD